jgi:hypothetical protein
MAGRGNKVNQRLKKGQATSMGETAPDEIDAASAILAIVPQLAKYRLAEVSISNAAYLPVLARTGQLLICFAPVRRVAHAKCLHLYAFPSFVGFLAMLSAIFGRSQVDNKQQVLGFHGDVALAIEVFLLAWYAPWCLDRLRAHRFG